MTSEYTQKVINKTIGTDINEYRPFGKTVQWAFPNFYDSRHFQNLLLFSEYESERDRDLAYITGSSAIKAIHFLVARSYFTIKDIDWLLEQTGNQEEKRQSLTELDIWATSNLREFLIEESQLRYYEQKSRTVKGLVLSNLIEKTASGVAKLQLHTVPDSSLTPMEQCIWLAPTNLHMVGVRIIGSRFVVEDPKLALLTAKNEQLPPMHLISSENPFRKNIGRIINGLMIYALTTPFNKRCRYEYNQIEKYIASNLPNLTKLEFAVLIEKFNQWFRKTQSDKSKHNNSSIAFNQLDRIGLSFLITKSK